MIEIFYISKPKVFDIIGTHLDLFSLNLFETLLHERESEAKFIRTAFVLFSCVCYYQKNSFWLANYEFPLVLKICWCRVGTCQKFLHLSNIKFFEWNKLQWYIWNFWRLTYKLKRDYLVVFRGKWLSWKLLVEWSPFRYTSIYRCLKVLRSGREYFLYEIFWLEIEKSTMFLIALFA